MKNLKKVFALVVAFSMMLSCAVAFAAYPDVTEDTPYASAITTLTALGIVGGDDQGNFNPDSTITRAEFTKIICEIQNMNGEGNKGATAFTDVAADHWASGYINFASSMGIINGMGDGTFNPDGPVTYEQAVKMLVATLGYEPMAQQMGGYPTGYLAVAQQRGVLSGITAPASTDPAPRNLIAQITYNALDVPMMVQTGFGNDITYEIQDGNNYTARTTLLTSRLDVAKLGGVVIANEKVAIDGQKTKTGYVRFIADENYKNTDDTWQIGNATSETTPFTFYVGETNAIDLLGYRCVAYAREISSNEFELVAIVPEEGKNNALTIDAADLDNSDRFVTSGSDMSLAYFESDDARRSTQVDLNSTLYIVWNNNNRASTEITSTLEDLKKNDYAARLNLVDWDNDDIYDFIRVDEYQHVVVDEIDAENGIIRTKGGDRINLQLDDSDVSVTIKDEEGNDVALDTIETDDVLAIITDGTSVKDTQFENMDIVVLKAATNMISGTVTEKDSSSSSRPRVYVDGEEYLIDTANDATTISEITRMDVSTEGVFYIGIDGKIFDYDGSRTGTDGEFGLILQAGDNGSSFDEGIALKMLTNSGLATYAITDDVRIKAQVKEITNSEGVVTGREFGTASYDIDEVLDKDIFAETNFESLFTSDMTLLDFFLEGKRFDAITEGLDNDSLGEIVLTRVIKFKVDSNGYITQIAPASNVQGSTYAETFTSSVDDEVLANPSTFVASTGEYREDTMRLDGSYLSENAVVFDLNKNNFNNSKVLDVSSLADESEYTAIMFDEDTDGYNLVVKLDGVASYTNDGFAIVTRTSVANDANGDEVTRITFVQNGESEEKVVTFDDDSSYDSQYNRTSYEELSQGDVFLYEADANGLVSSYTVIGQIASDGVLRLESGIAGADFGTSRDSVEFRLGYINDELSGGRMEIAFGEEVGVLSSDVETYRLSGVNEYRYNDVNSRNVRVEVGSYSGGDVSELYEEDGVTYVSYVLVRLYNDNISDIYSFNQQIGIE